MTNSSPQFASPPVVYLMKGCGGQEYAVAPVDPEGDTVRCRWSSSSESHDMAWFSMLTQFSLDQDTCVVTYHPENDQATTGGSKAISVQVEDFDADGNLLHSVPLVFIALVSEPQLPNARSSSLFNKPLYTGLMGRNDDHHDSPSALSRKRRSDEPAYCAGRPSLIMPPSEVETIVAEYVAGEAIEIDWVAEYQLDGNSFTDIDRYQFVTPDGMTCSAFDASGVSQCTWTPEESQIGEHPHCATVYDPYGRSSERRCILIQLFEACDEDLERVEKYCLPPCSTGYERDESINCVDIDECSVAFGPCSPIIETCANNNGGFTCECSLGYERDATGACIDVDECALKTDNCANTVEKCNNSVGSFSCSCAPGFERNSDGDCIDIDECATGADSCAPVVETCINDIGSFTCPCSAGYERDEAGTCIDIDECARKTDNCANTVEECVNSVGSFDCPCASGFERNIEGRCLDINECVKETDTCVGFTETCENTFGSFKCPKSAAFKMMIMQQAILGGL